MELNDGLVITLFTREHKIKFIKVSPSDTYLLKLRGKQLPTFGITEDFKVVGLGTSDIVANERMEVVDET